MLVLSAEKIGALVIMSQLIESLRSVSQCEHGAASAG